jgi:lipopolysaccharide/colanic/teichoic acid biosynthesis glycosyltransferase
MKARQKIEIGFQPKSWTVYRFYNFSLAAGLLLMVFPLLVIISIALLVTQGPQIFYRAERLGKDQKVFKIIKFRTLCSKRAQELTKDRTLPAGSNIETPLGGLLRETRLDELPQLLNIISGEMNLCGPRPVRSEIAAIERDRILRYDMRFQVKPGLVGPTQAYFGHGVSKRLRARMNNRLVRRPVSIPAELMLLSRIAYSMLAKTGRKALKLALKVNKRELAPRNPEMWLEGDGGRTVSHIDKIDGQEMVVPSLSTGSDDRKTMLYVKLKSGGLRKARVSLSKTSKPGAFKYTMANDLSQFVIERYALGMVVVPAQVSKRKSAPAMPNLVKSEVQA